MQGFELIVICFDGGIFGLSLCVPEAFPDTKSCTAFGVRMQKPPGFRMLRVWKNNPSRLGSAISSIGKNQSTVMQLPVDRMIVVKESKFSALEDCLWHQDEPETPRLSLMVLDQADRKRPLPQWLGFHDLCKGSSGVRDKCQINRKIALDPRTLIALVAGVQGTVTPVVPCILSGQAEIVRSVALLYATLALV